MPLAHDNAPLVFQNFENATHLEPFTQGAWWKPKGGCKFSANLADYTKVFKVDKWMDEIRWITPVAGRIFFVTGAFHNQICADPNF